MRRLIALCFGCFIAFQAIAHDGPLSKSSEDENDSVIVERRQAREKINLTDFAMALYRPNYILPYYYTASPYERIYRGDTPDDQRINENEFKFQLSLIVPIWYNIMDTKFDIDFAYTQQSYWQVYTESAWFRETNYEPELMVHYTFDDFNQVTLSLNHESNGRGGEKERSWNRLIGEYTHGHENWMVKLRAWLMIFEAVSSDLHNPNIEDYLGHGEILGSYKYDKFVFTLQAGNFERPKRFRVEGSISYPITNKLLLYVQGFSGYGQSLIEYDHHTNAFGIGIAFNDWLS